MTEPLKVTTLAIKRAEFAELLEHHQAKFRQFLIHLGMIDRLCGCSTVRLSTALLGLSVSIVAQTYIITNAKN